jgi:hypothetical protein
LKSNAWETDSATISLVQDCSKLLGELVKFYVSELQDLGQLRSRLHKMAFSAICRIAGFKSIMLLQSKSDYSTITNRRISTAHSSPIASRAPALEYILPAILGKLGTNAVVDANDKNIWMKNDHERSGRIEVMEGNIHHLSRFSSFICCISVGHYTSGLGCINKEIHDELIHSFESLYEYIVQLLGRCTWSGILMNIVIHFCICFYVKHV